MPGLDTNEGRAGFAPEAQVRRIRKLQNEPRTSLCPIAQALAANGGEDHDVVFEELVGERQTSCVNWRGISDRRHQAGGVEAANRLRLFEAEFESMQRARSAKRQWPAKRR